MHKFNHRITWKEFGKRIDPAIKDWCCVRWSEGEGKFWKGQLAKARRQLEKSIIRYELGIDDKIRDRRFAGVSGTVNWRNW